MHSPHVPNPSPIRNEQEMQFGGRLKNDDDPRVKNKEKPNLPKLTMQLKSI